MNLADVLVLYNAYLQPHAYLESKWSCSLYTASQNQVLARVCTAAIRYHQAAAGV